MSLASFPSTNFTPGMMAGSRDDSFKHRQLFAALSMAVGPDLGITPALDGSPPQGLEIPLPGCLEVGDGSGRESCRIRAEDRLDGLGQVAGADPGEVEPGDQLVEALGPLQVRRQDRRGEPDALSRRPAVVDAGLSDREVADARLDVAPREIAVASTASARSRRAPSRRRAVRMSRLPEVGSSIGRVVDSSTAA